MRKIILILFLCVFSIASITSVDAYEVQHVQPWKNDPTPVIPEHPALENISDPNAYGKITQYENEFKLYRGSLVTFPVIINMYDFIHDPILEIMYNDVSIKTLKLFSNGDEFHSLILLDDNWESGSYKINLKYKNNLYDTSSFNIVRDNEVLTEVISFDSMNNIDSFVTITPPIISFNDYPQENFLISGKISDSRIGHKAVIEITTPNNEIIHDSVITSSSGFFTNPILIDDSWVSGDYSVTVKYLNTDRLFSSFTIENKGASPIFLESNLIGSFSVSSELSNNYTVLSISGNIETDESEMTLHITKDDIIMFEDTLSLTNQSFETNTVLYDYVKNTSWEYGEYQITGLVGEETFHSQFFTLDEQSFSILEITSMDLFLNLGSGLEKMVDKSEIEINVGDEKQVTLSGILENYSVADVIEIHLVYPDGNEDISYIIASSTGSYYLPIIIDDSWISGDYTAYVTYENFIDTPSSFEVINNSISEEIAISEIEDEKVITTELKNYSIFISNSQTSDSIHYNAMMKSFSGKTPIEITLNDELVKEEFSFSGIDGFIDYYLLLDETWKSGDYVLSYVENNVSVPFGTFTIENNYIPIGESDEIPVEQLITTQPLTLSDSVFKSSSYVVDYLSFSGKLGDDSTKDVSVLLDGDLQTTVSLDSDGNYGGIISLGDNLNSGFHNVMIISGDVVESVDFLIATNDSISLVDDLEIFRNTVVESGGKISISLNDFVPNFVPSEIEYVVITVEGDNSYDRFSILPLGYGLYSHNFMIDDSVGSYDVSVKYGDQIIEFYTIDILPVQYSWIQSHTASWQNNEMSDYSYFKKIILLLDENYDVTPNVMAPEWFVESADNWMNGLMDDDSFNDAILFLAENRLL